MSIADILRPMYGPRTLEQTIEQHKCAIELAEARRDRQAAVIHMLCDLVSDPDITGEALNKIVRMWRHEVFDDREQERLILKLQAHLADLRKDL